VAEARLASHSFLPFSPCGRRWRGRSPRRMRGLYPRRQTPHPASSRCARFRHLSHKGRGCLRGFAPCPAIG
jgi:hypothetical protein